MPRRLPDPINKLSLNNVNFSVFLAKDFFQTSWKHIELLKLVKQARTSYLKYGAVPLIDAYDPKSLVYLVRAEYPHLHINKKVVLSEWLCVRFTPAEGKPEVTEDFLLSANGQGSLKEELEKKHGIAHFKNFVSISRICRIPPSNPKKNIRLERNGYTLACFILANRTFLNHRHNYGPFKYISGLFRPELLEKKFSATIKGKKLPRYAAAKETLKLTGPEGVRITRNFYIYSYPGYFLQLANIYACLKNLSAKKILSKKTLDYYLGTGNLQTLEWFKSHSSRLGKFLATKGTLKFSKLTGAGLRKICNAEVADGPQLKIMSKAVWEKDINTIISNFSAIV